MSKPKQGSVLWAMIWMAVLSIVLFWLPVAGPLIAGVVGGKKAGGVGPAILAVLLPGIILGVFLFFLASSLTGIPVIGFLAGLGGFVFALIHSGLLLLGAVIGGILA
jgi:hypothetical protein